MLLFLLACSTPPPEPEYTEPEYTEPGDTEPEVVTGPEVCDGLDNDGDTFVDDGLFLDADEDGYGGIPCVMGRPVATIGGDCDDENPAVNPSAVDDTCGGVDDDCDGQVDEEVPEVEGECSDGLDNDCDALMDCEDADCSWDCEEHDCLDGLDNDADGDVDCADFDCAGHTSCRTQVRVTRFPGGLGGWFGTRWYTLDSGELYYSYQVRWASGASGSLQFGPAEKPTGTCQWTLDHWVRHSSFGMTRAFEYDLSSACPVTSLEPFMPALVDSFGAQVYTDDGALWYSLGGPIESSTASDFWLLRRDFNARAATLPGATYTWTP